MKRIIISCDECGRDQLPGFYLELRSNFVECAGLTFIPELEDNVYFCGIRCLRRWLDKNYPIGSEYNRK